MQPRWASSVIIRIFRILSLVALLSLILPPAVSAAPAGAITVVFDIITIIKDESITIRTRDFPVRTDFVVIMGKATNKAKDGVQAATWNSGKGGIVEATFSIPEEIKGERIIGVRIESKDGYTAYNWFINTTQYALVPDANIKPSLVFSDVKKNQSVTVEAMNLPPFTTFRVRIGPHYTFYRDYASVESVTTDKTGSAKFTIPFGKNVQDAEFVSVRLDGGSRYVFSTFSNVTGGKEVPASQLYKIVPCTIIAINPIPALKPREDFDAVWTVQNTGLSDWDMRRYIFKYRGGEEMHKRENKQFLPYTVERGWSFDFAVDMLAPETPGWHTTTWALVFRDDSTVCEMKISVFVEE